MDSFNLDSARRWEANLGRINRIVVFMTLTVAKRRLAFMLARLYRLKPATAADG